MKKALVSILFLLLVFLLLIPVAISEGNGDIYISFIDGDWYAFDNTGKEPSKKWIGDIAPNYKDYLLQRDFPVSVIRDVSDLCKQHHGTPVGWLGLVSDKGINLRKAPNLGNSYIITTLKEGTTVYVYFKFTDAGNKEWYYATTASGTCGYLRSNFIKLYPYTGKMSGAAAEATENSIRLDTTAEDYKAWADTAFNKIHEWYNGPGQLDNCPLLLEPVTFLLNEFRSNSSTLENQEYNVSWYSDALKVAFDERMIGVKVTVEFGNEDEKKEIDVTNSVNWHDGILNFELWDDYSFEDISTLRIEYWNYPNFYSHAYFRLAYDVSDGKVICKNMETEIDNGRYIAHWAMKCSNESDDMYLCGLFYDLAVDAEFGLNFDLMTGEYLY